MDIADIFPVAVVVTELQSLTPEVSAKAIEMIELADLITDLDSDGSYTREQQLLDKVIFRDVKSEILSCCMEFARAYSHLVDEIEICNSWGNVIGKGQTIRFHKHINSYIIGSLYLSEGSAFTFHNFQGENLFSVQPEIAPDTDNYRSQQSFVINPKPARLVLFPSGLHHSVLQSQDAEKRYSIAFNTIPIGKIGTPTNLMELKSA